MLCIYIYTSHCENCSCFLSAKPKKGNKHIVSFASGESPKKPGKNRQLGFHFLIVAFGSGMVQFPKLPSSSGW